MQAQGMWSAGEADDKERFLAELRALRDEADLEFDELAARAHYPADVLVEAANGPSLPGLPILVAYVRACDGDVLEWEERWRRLGVESRADPGLPVRPAGASPAAVAGARAGVSVAPPDAYDPERIRAALRGSHGRSDRGARGTVNRAGRWDGAVADLSGTPANGNHHVLSPDDGLSDAAVIQVPDSARTDALRRDPFSADWLRDSELTSPPGPGSGSPERAGAGASSASPDGWFTPREAADSERTWSSADTEPLAAWFTPPELADGGPVQPQPAEHEVAPPGPPPAPEQVIPRASWPAPAESPAGSAAPPSQSRPDRLYPVRLLAVIVVAALIGSILVLLLR